METCIEIENKDSQTEKTLEKALACAKDRQLPLIIASTTGASARQALRLVANNAIRLIVVTHDRPGCPKPDFDPGVAEHLKDMQHTVLAYLIHTSFPLRALRWVAKKIKINVFNHRNHVLEEILGVGGRVCFDLATIAFQAHQIRAGDCVVVVAGQKSGLNTALVLEIQKTDFQSVSLKSIITLPQKSKSDVMDCAGQQKCCCL